MRKGRTPEQILAMSNDRGEVGYAYGGDDADLPGLEEAVARGWLVFGYDASPGISGKYHGQKRHVFFVTDKFRARRRDAKGQ